MAIVTASRLTLATRNQLDRLCSWGLNQVSRPALRQLLILISAQGCMLGDLGGVIMVV